VNKHDNLLFSVFHNNLISNNFRGNAPACGNSITRFFACFSFYRKKSHSHIPDNRVSPEGDLPSLVAQQRRGITPLSLVTFFHGERVIAIHQTTWGSPEGVRPLWCRSNVAALPRFLWLLSFTGKESN
jgi:hypothetical protein